MASLLLEERLDKYTPVFHQFPLIIIVAIWCAYVLICIYNFFFLQVSKSVPEYGIGPKESDKNEREFTEEQLQAGKHFIGLQAGSNKGATQSGQNFGLSRQIL